MKLGDNMTMEACNVWSDVTPRKYRPPRIGDIPKRGAIDEESPSYSKVTVSPSGTQLSVDARAGPSRVSSEESSDSGEIQEIRKDSALYLEEAEGSKKTARSRPPGIFRKARRESSGYATSVGSLDEERKGSVSSESQQQQDSSQSQSPSQSQSLKEKRRITRIPRAEESLGEKTSIGTSERMPTTEIHRKVSSAGLDMPDIEEVKEVLREETSPRQGSRQNLSRDAETAGADHLSAQPRLPREAANQTLAVKSDVASGVVSSAASHDGLPKESLDTGSLKEALHRISCETNRRLDRSAVGLGCGKTRETSPVGSREDPPCSAERVTAEIAGRKDEKVACSNDTSSGSVEASKAERTPVVVASSSSAKTSVKVYQLLATQSEDRSDGELHLPDRRISLQIAGSRDTEVSPTNNNTTATGVFVRSGKCESTPTTVTDDNSATKTSLPGETGPQRYLGDAGSVTVRPIYPYCPYSPYGSPQGSPRNRRRPLRESRRVSIDNRQGDIKLNQYKLLDDIGQGTYGLVKLVYNEEDGAHYAMKILSKKRLMKKAGIFGRIVPGKKTDPLARVYKEIALLKKVDHPNVVKLVEVLDDQEEDHLYLVFELQRGEILQIPTDEPLDEKTARRNFRDVVMGVEYLHYQRIVHRDIKPSNLLVDNDGRIKIADLGVSAELRAPGELLSGGAGTPAFAPPETTIPSAQYSGPPCDVWSMGVTLYSLVTGSLPWNGSGSIGSVYAAARSQNLKFPEKPAVSDDLRDLITRMLVKEPADRITLPQIKEHAWLTNRGAESLPSEADNCRVPVTVTDEEVERVVTRVPKLDTLILIKTMLKQHSFQNPFLPKRSGRTVGNDVEAGPSGSSSQKRDAKAEQFHRAGRSMSAPDSYDLHTSGRQMSVENPLPPVTEASNQESEVEKR
ncbi:PREDICTED: serine/threonine-protein kinase STE20 isoform X3 [Dinoponera quadriceps]|uniref:calcium/calmodulin-dependent protein kinase n=1 Tax=Dinoponera quadriceps TaxID=609295 RepID=A0A6P3YCG9_DINQU|nr:PREDICTED: serine/threonine-protein kinase STE20 isoform X3 [Dinoponera quadriceps]XP_014488721.1 PREDICTED: serine/threonine-protein kinase STE20 isoform X3 [Dinoponera quadriceps]